MGNYIPANPLVTPAHIVPEWYFLPFYAILRSIPNKLGGVLLLLSAIFILLIMPFIIKSEIRSSQFRPLAAIFFWVFLGQFCTFFYFFYFLFILIFLSKLESNLWFKLD